MWFSQKSVDSSLLLALLSVLSVLLSTPVPAYSEVGISNKPRKISSIRMRNEKLRFERAKRQDRRISRIAKMLREMQSASPNQTEQSSIEFCDLPTFRLIVPYFYQSSKNHRNEKANQAALMARKLESRIIAGIDKISANLVHFSYNPLRLSRISIYYLPLDADEPDNSGGLNRIVPSLKPNGELRGALGSEIEVTSSFELLNIFPNLTIPPFERYPDDYVIFGVSGLDGMNFPGNLFGITHPNQGFIIIEDLSRESGFNDFASKLFAHEFAHSQGVGHHNLRWNLMFPDIAGISNDEYFLATLTRAQARTIAAHVCGVPSEQLTFRHRYGYFGINGDFTFEYNVCGNALLENGDECENSVHSLGNSCVHPTSVPPIWDPTPQAGVGICVDCKCVPINGGDDDDDATASLPTPVSPPVGSGSGGTTGGPTGGASDKPVSGCLLAFKRGTAECGLDSDCANEGSCDQGTCQCYGACETRDRCAGVCDQVICNDGSHPACIDGCCGSCPIIGEPLGEVEPPPSLPPSLPISNYLSC